MTFEESLDYRPGAAPLSVRVVGCALVPAYPRVQQRIARPGIEAGRARIVTVQHSDIGDTADIEHDPCFTAAAK